MRPPRSFPLALGALAIALLAALPARAGEAPFAFGLSSPAPQECVGPGERSALELGKGFSSSQATPEKGALRDFFRKAAEEPPLGDDAALLTGWIGEAGELETVLAEPARADLVARDGLSGNIALLRPTHTPATCGSGGCFTPTFVALGCETGSAIACLSDQLPWGTLALRADLVRFLAYSGRDYMETSHCRCEGAGNCFKSVQVFRIDREMSEFALEAEATWRLDAVLMEKD
ncbi:hypothetical protein [Afifella sp. IM 167]|uniref:hypothetical protein n=1 Tax=Afifella sp. IM 167 TaxID=2033586 RepID=UPI001CCE9A29|nr:hypothetical protein [Afifella sp. IM 167]MBZ8135347.1 hypothetical protein [Afifella sp. IM 167]